MELSAEEYAAFEEKVKRTVYIDNMSPQVTESVIRTALNQFAVVKSVKFIPNCVVPISLPQCALVELDSAKKAKQVIEMIKQYPFMMSGMPRPVRAHPAVMDMFEDRPVKPNRKMKCYWLEQSDPDLEVAMKVKNLIRKHSAEITLMHKVLLKEEAKLTTKQVETLKVHYKKHRGHYERQNCPYFSKKVQSTCCR